METQFILERILGDDEGLMPQADLSELAAYFPV